MSPKAANLLLAAMPKHKPSGLRDRAIVLTCVFTALRRREVMRLGAGDLTHDAAVSYYRVRTKGGLERHRELPRPAAAAIAQYLALSGRRLEDPPPAAPLWDNSDMALYANLRRYARKGRAHIMPDVLRHAAAKLRRVTGVSLEDVSALLGHRSIATTARYLARLDGEQDTSWPAVAALLGVE
jgi:integrase